MKRLKSIKNWALDRLTEYTTWVGIGAVIAGAAEFEGVTRIAIIVCGVIGVLVKEKSSTPAE